MKNLKCILQILPFVVAILFTNQASTQEIPANPLNKEGWKLDFNDEFNGEELDEKVWLPYYLPHMTSRKKAAADYEFRDGAIVIKIEKDHPVYNDRWGRLVVSSIQSFEVNGLHHPAGDGGHEEPMFDGYTTKYGYFEIRAKIPGGKGGHVAWWMIGCQDKPSQSAEIDIVENPFHLTKQMYANIHAWKDPNIAGEKIRNPLDFDLADSWHIYGFEWDENGIKFYVDNELIAESKNSPDYRMCTLLGLYRDCGWDGENDNVYPKEFVVDYFRVYKKIK